MNEMIAKLNQFFKNRGVKIAVSENLLDSLHSWVDQLDSNQAHISSFEYHETAYSKELRYEDSSRDTKMCIEYDIHERLGVTVYYRKGAGELITPYDTMKQRIIETALLLGGSALFSSNPAWFIVSTVPGVEDQSNDAMAFKNAVLSYELSHK